MTPFQHAAQIVSTPPVQFPATGASIFTIVAAFLDKIHGPAATVGVILGGLWVVLQIYLAVEKRWFRKDK